MKRILLILVIGFIVANIQSQDFRKATWDSSMKEVKATEDVEWTENSSGGLDFIYFEGTLLDRKALIAYYFFKDKLIKGKYIIIEEHTNDNDYLNDFRVIQKALEKKYPTADTDEYWNNDLYKDDYSHYGFAISLGHYSLFTTIKLEETTIIQGITGDNYKIRNELEYTANAGWKNYKEYKEEESDSDL